MKLLAYRLYLSVQVLVTATSVLVVLWWGVAELHDRHVAAADFACYDSETSGLSEPRPTAQEMQRLRSWPKPDDEEWEEISGPTRKPLPKPVVTAKWVAAAEKCHIEPGSRLGEYSRAPGAPSSRARGRASTATTCLPSGWR
jgi:hypothetical protein